MVDSTDAQVGVSPEFHRLISVVGGSYAAFNNAVAYSIKWSSSMNPVQVNMSVSVLRFWKPTSAIQSGVGDLVIMLSLQRGE